MPKQVLPTFEQFAMFLRNKTGNKSSFPITPTTLFENDLGITGDEGVELLEAVEKEYGISLGPLPDLLSMQPNEYLFHSEGLGLIDFQELKRVIDNLFRETKEPKPIVRSFQVGELYDAICRLTEAT